MDTLAASETYLENGSSSYVPSRKRRQKKMRWTIVALFSLLLASLATFLPASTYAYSIDFNSFATGTAAESLVTPGVTFTGAPVGSWVISPSFFTTLTGQILYQPVPAGSLTIAFATAQNAVAFHFGTSSNPATVSVTAYNGLAQIVTRTFTGTLQTSGFPEGFARIGADNITSVQISVSTGAMAIDDLVTGVAQPEAADIVAQLRVTPDRVASNDPENLITYNFNLKNVGAGTANALRFYLPIDSNLVLGYATFSDPRSWVSAVNTTTVTVSLPQLFSNDELSGSIVFRPNSSPPAGTRVSTRYRVAYDDAAGGGRSRYSNGVTFEFGNPGTNTDTAKGAVQLMSPSTVSVASGTSVSFSANFFIPDEQVTTWLTDPNGKSVAGSGGYADKDGKLTVTVNTTGLGAGGYVAAVYGTRSSITGSGVININGVAPASIKNMVNISSGVITVKGSKVVPTNKIAPPKGWGTTSAQAKVTTQPTNKLAPSPTATTTSNASKPANVTTSAKPTVSSGATSPSNDTKQVASPTVTTPPKNSKPPTPTPGTPPPNAASSEGITQVNKGQK